jgi:ethanolamine utilization protein EutN
MRLAKVVGNVVSTIKLDEHKGFKLLLVQPVDITGKFIDTPVVAIDCAQAGVDDYVLILEEGLSCREVMKAPKAPVEAVIVGVIDYIESQGMKMYLSGG